MELESTYKDVENKGQTWRWIWRTDDPVLRYDMLTRRVKSEIIRFNNKSNINYLFKGNRKSFGDFIISYKSGLIGDWTWSTQLR